MPLSWNDIRARAIEFFAVFGESYGLSYVVLNRFTRGIEQNYPKLRMLSERRQIATS